VIGTWQLLHREMIEHIEFIHNVSVCFEGLAVYKLISSLFT